MKKGTIIEGVIDELKFPNKASMMCFEPKLDKHGNPTDEGEMVKVQIKNALPGQKVRAVIAKKKSGRLQARLDTVLEKSPLEDGEKQCIHFEKCGGCTYQTMSYENQLKVKSQMVKDIIDKVVSDYEYEGILGSPNQWEYRNKMEYTFGDEVKGGEMCLGMHKKGSFYDIITTNECLIVNNDFNKISTCVLEFFKELNVDFYHKLQHVGYARHLLIRRGITSKEITVNIVTSTQEVNKDGQEISIEDIKDRLLKLDLEGKIVGIIHNYNDNMADMVASENAVVLYGQEYLYEQLLDLNFKISTFSFFQTNTLGAEVLYSKAREYIGQTKDKTIFDLYSGTGTIAQILAPVAKKVIGVEIVEEAVMAARENARLNNLDNCEFIAGDVLKVIDEIKEKPDLIVLDPPRFGIHPKALSKIIEFGVDKMVYISCKPTSLARDLEVLQENGYKVEKVCAVDMFANTVHVETVVLMSRVQK